jgi:putative NADH-flavin reductase
MEVVAMRVVVFGSTGGTGQELVAQALARGHQVTAFARDPAAVRATHPRLRAVQGDALDPAAVEDAVDGQQAVLSALGGAPGGPPHVKSQATGNLVKAMRATGVRRLVVVSGMHAAAFDGHPEELTAPLRLLLPRLARLRALFEDNVRTEALVRESDLDWVVVRPAILTDGPRTGAYRTGPPLRFGLRSRIARADVAELMLRQVDQDTHLRQVVRVSG